jgi:hypothetical protein
MKIDSFNPAKKISPIYIQSYTLEKKKYRILFSKVKVTTISYPNSVQ